MNILSINNISKSYKDLQVLSDVSLQLHQANCYGLIGENGTGKSTLLSIIVGAVKPDNGNVLFGSQQLTKKHLKVIGYLPQKNFLIQSLTVKDNIKLWASACDVKDYNQAIKEIPQFLNIDAILNKKVDELSGGTQKKVQIAIVLMKKPEFIILDEPFIELDETTVNLFIQHLINLKQNNCGLLICSHTNIDNKKLYDQILKIEKQKLINV